MAKDWATKEQDVVDYFVYIKNKAVQERANVDQSWDTNLNLYMDRYEFPDKLDWQTKVKDPIIDNLVVRMTNFFVRLLMSTDNSYFATKHKEKSIAKGVNDLIRWCFRTNKYPLTFGDSFKMALLTSPYYNKVSYKYFTERYPTYDDATGEYGFANEIVGRVCIESKDPRNMWLDPDGDGYIIEKEDMYFSDFLTYAEANNYENVDSVKLKVVTGDTTDDDEATVRQNNFDPKVRLYHVYTKAITDKDGEVLDEHIKFTIAENDVIVDYRDNLLPKGEFPYVRGFPMKVLVGRYGRGYIEKLRSVILTYLESLNLIMDSFTLATLGAYEVVVDNIANDQSKSFTSITAGRIYPVTEPNTINRVFNQAIDPLALNIISFFDRLIQNRSFQNEFFQGQPTAKGRPTALEINTKTEQSEGFFSDIANEVERSIIEPTLWLVVATEFIYMNDPKHINLKNAVGVSPGLLQVAGLPFGRKMEILKNMEFEVRGISGKILKMANFQKIIQILNVAGNIPGALQGIDLKALIEDIFDSMDKDVTDMFHSLDQPQQGTGQGVPQGTDALTAAGQQGIPQQSTPQNITAGIQGG